MPNGVIDCVVTSPPYWSQRNYNTEPQIWGGDKDCDHVFQQGKVIKMQPKRDHLPNGDYADTRGNELSRKVVDLYTGDTCQKCGAWRGELGMEDDFKAFIAHLVEIFAEVKRVLKPTGTLFVNIGDSYGGSGHGEPKDAKSGDIVGKNRILDNEDNKSGKLQHSQLNKSLIGITDRFKIAMIDELGFKCRNEIIWHKPNQTPQSATDRFTNDYEKVYFFTKSNKYDFNQQFEPYSEPIKRRGVRALVPNVKNRNMRTVWSINTKASGVNHFATFPDELPRRCIVAGCPMGGVVLDPFAGVSTTLKVAKRLGREYVGIELNDEYANMGIEKVAESESEIQEWIDRVKNHVAKEGHELTMLGLANDGQYYARICPRGFNRLAFKSCWHHVLNFGDLTTKALKKAKGFDTKTMKHIFYEN